MRLITVDCSYRTDATRPVDYMDGSTSFGEPMEPEIGSQAYGEFFMPGERFYAGRYDNGFSVKRRVRPDPSAVAVHPVSACFSPQRLHPSWLIPRS